MKEAAITRFAPSPTGYIHVGNVRSAIYPYLLAKQTGGKFILRIEDTDTARFVPGATEMILDTLKWLGLDWDEGPVYQSGRKGKYKEWALRLIASGRAYADPTPTEKIEEYRRADNAAKVPYLYRNHRPENPPEWQEGMPLRFKAEPREYKWHDEVMGDLETGPEVLDDIILVKKDGMPTYNFAHIVDDAEMGVNYVIRGVEYLSSMPNYLALYDALGLERPKFVSLPHILAPNSKKKLSKRDGAKSVTDYRADGVLAEAMLNYLACLGWNDGTEQEIYSKEELLERFSLDRVQSSGAQFDETKLLWLNGQWIRKIYDAGQDLMPYTEGFWPESAAAYPEEYRRKVLAIIYDRLKTLGDLKTMTGYFFEEPEIDLLQISGNKFLKKMSEQEYISLLQLTFERLSEVSDWTALCLQDALNTLLAETGKKPAELFSLIRIAISFAPFSPALHETMEVLGRERTLARVNAVRTAWVNDGQ